MTLDVTKFDVLMIDPPWPKRKGGRRQVRPNQGRQLDYKTMSIENIALTIDRDVLTQAADTCAVFLWTIDQFLHAGESIFEQRGFRRHARFIWDKKNGVAPCFTVRFAHEYLVWFYRPRLMPIAETARGKLTTVISESAREHSRKPNAAYAAVEMLYPNARRIDVFSREVRLGWAQFGDQLSHFDDQASAAPSPQLTEASIL